ncbi:hypothetical protein ABLO16_18195, partial [Mycobacterium tuberculosis]
GHYATATPSGRANSASTACLSGSSGHLQNTARIELSHQPLSEKLDIFAEQTYALKSDRFMSGFQIGATEFSQN